MVISLSLFFLVNFLFSWRQFFQLKEVKTVQILIVLHSTVMWVLFFTQFTVDYKLQFNLFPISYIAENKSLKSQFEKIKKKTFKPVKNTTILKSIFNKEKNAIVLGMGCIEELLPSFFKRNTLNQCHPTSFIIDNIMEEDGLFATHIRTSLDHIHAPRVIPWSRVFNSVRNYQNIHPLRSWELYAIY